MKIKNLIQTSDVCPSQWEFRTEDDRPVYVHYRFGCLSVYVGKEGNDTVWGELDSPPVYEKQIGERFDGRISWKSVLAIIKKIPELQG